MANKTIPDLTALGADAASGDLLEIADISNANASRKITVAEAVGAILAVLRANSGTADISGVALTLGTAALGTPSSGTLTNCTIPASGITAGILGASVTFGENTALIYDAALSADGKYCGLVRAGTAGTTLAFGDLCYLAAADSRWELADADAASTSGDVLLGMCVLAAAADGDATTMLMMGFIRADAAFPALTISAPAYVSTTAGDIQVAQPSGTDDVIRVAGYAWTADELYFNPSGFYITHT